MLVDTQMIASELEAADLPAEQAEAIAAAVGRSVTETAATKADLELVKHELKAEIEKTRNQLLTWLMSAIVAVAGIIIAVIKL